MCTQETKSYLFQTYCSPMYTAQLWWSYNTASIRKLNVAYNSVFRLLHRLPRYCSASTMFVDFNVKNCYAVIRNLIFRFMERLELSKNSIIISVLNSDLRFVSRIRRHWMKLLFLHSDFIHKMPYEVLHVAT